MQTLTEGSWKDERPPGGEAGGEAMEGEVGGVGVYVGRWWGGGDTSSPLPQEGAGPEPHPDNDIQKSNSVVSNNNGGAVNPRSWTGPSPPHSSRPSREVPVSFS